MGRVRAYLGAVKRGEAIFGPSLLLLLLLVATVWFGYRSALQEAAGQETTTEPLQEATIPEPDLTELLEDDLAVDERPPAAIPGLSDMEVIGNLRYVPGTNFRCPGGSPDQGLYRRVCRSSSADDSPVVYDVTVVEEHPRTVLWLRADAYQATDEAAAEDFAYVANLSLGRMYPINAGTGVGENISSGGEYAAEGARLRLYGTEGARTLEIVGTGVPSDIIRNRGGR